MPTPRDYISKLIDELKKDHADPNVPDYDKNRALLNDDYLKALIAIQKSPVAYESTITAIKNESGLTTTAIKDQIGAFRLQMRAEQKPKEKTADEVIFDISVETEAKRIIEAGEAYEYIYEVWQSRVKGNPFLGKSCITSRSTQSCLNTKGIHIYANGKHGEGKSHGLSEAIRLLSPNRVIDGDVSLKNLFYDGDSLLDATTLHLDDINLDDGLASLTKKMTTKFQDGAEYRTIIDGIPEKLQLPKRLAIWASSVDIHGDEQYRDRWLDVAINEGQTADIIEFMKEQDKKQRDDKYFQFKTEVCRYIYKDLAENVFYVEIPYTDEFDFPVSEKTRGYAIFSDMIKGFAALRYAKRVTNELGHLIADSDDFFDAKELYEGIHGHSDMEFTTPEQNFLNALIKLGREADVKQMAKQTGLSEPRIRQIASGRGNDEQKRNGLLAKCSALTSEFISIFFKDEYENRSTKKIMYKLDFGFNLMDGKTELITVKENSKTLAANRRNTEKLQKNVENPWKNIVL